MLLIEVQPELPRKPKLPISLHDVRVGLAMSQRELSVATWHVLGKQGIAGVSTLTILRAENGKPIQEVNAMKILMTVNAIYKARGRTPPLSIDDVTWTISRRKPKKGEDIQSDTEEWP